MLGRSQKLQFDMFGCEETIRFDRNWRRKSIQSFTTKSWRIEVVHNMLQSCLAVPMIRNEPSNCTRGYGWGMIPNTLREIVNMVMWKISQGSSLSERKDCTINPIVDQLSMSQMLYAPAATASNLQSNRYKLHVHPLRNAPPVWTTMNRTSSIHLRPTNRITRPVQPLIPASIPTNASNPNTQLVPASILAEASNPTTLLVLKSRNCMWAIGM